MSNTGQPEPLDFTNVPDWQPTPKMRLLAAEISEMVADGPLEEHWTLPRYMRLP